MNIMMSFRSLRPPLALLAASRLWHFWIAPIPLKEYLVGLKLSLIILVVLSLLGYHYFLSCPVSLVGMSFVKSMVLYGHLPST